MSYIVKGKEIPINCSECSCVSSNFMFCRVAAKPIPSIGHPEFCPLVELPDPKIIAARMQSIDKTAHNHNEEEAHIEADDLMCELLTELGYGEAVRIFERMEKWYS